MGGEPAVVLRKSCANQWVSETDCLQINPFTDSADASNCSYLTPRDLLMAPPTSQIFQPSVQEHAAAESAQCKRRSLTGTSESHQVEASVQVGLPLP
jgi:hypothetical protein